MRPDLLHVVTARSNLARYQTPTKLFRRFVEHMLDSGVALTVVECSYGERPAEAHPLDRHFQHVHVRASGAAPIWNKENLLNLGIARLPEHARYIATIDADVTFRRPTWAEDTVHALQCYHVVQPWTHCYDLGPNDEHMQSHRSFCDLVFCDKPVVQGPNAKPGPYEFGHPGYAWAWTRQALEWVGGLIETAALGAADHHMAMALIGKADASIPGNISEAYKRPIKLWERRACQHIAGNIGAIPGTIEHGFHGPKADRKYIDRWGILISEGFEPELDLKRNTFGVLELSGRNPALRHKIDRYFRARNEDANVMG